jgi:hypothetical protein
MEKQIREFEEDEIGKMSNPYLQKLFKTFCSCLVCKHIKDCSKIGTSERACENCSCFLKANDLEEILKKPIDF